MNNLTAVITSFLRPDYTIDCVKSLRKTYPDIKIIVGDQDNNAKIKKMASKYKAEYINLEFDCGVGASRNRIIEQVKTEFVLVGDDDFLYNGDDKVNKMLIFLKGHKEFDLIGGRIIENGKIRNYQSFMSVVDDHIENEALVLEDVKMIDKKSGLKYAKVDLTFNFFVARTEMVKEIPWDEHIKVAYEHSHWFLSIKKAGKKVAFSPDPLVLHKFQGYQTTQEYKGYRSRKSDRDYFFSSLGIEYIKTLNGSIVTRDDRTLSYDKGVTWGVWDFCHEGHIKLLEHASSLCRELIVGVSTDAYVMKTKGKKPFFNYEHRSKLISSLKFVSKVYKQDGSLTKKALVKTENPNVIFAGDNKMRKEWSGEKLGVPVRFLPYTKGVSSTKLMNELSGKEANEVKEIVSEDFITKMTFVIKTFKGYSCLEKLLASIEKFYPKAQLIIADDNDETEFNNDFYMEWKRKLNIDLMRLPFDSGLSLGRNRMVSKCRNPFVLLLDDDFIFTKETDIEKFYKLLKAEKEAGVVGGVCLDNKTEVHFECNLKKSGSILTHLPDGDKYKEVDGIKVKETGCVLNFALFRRKVFKEVLWDDDLKLAEHIDFYMRFNQTNWKILYTPEVKVIHSRQREEKDYNEYRARSRNYQIIMFRKNRITKMININGVVTEVKDGKVIKSRI